MGQRGGLCSLPQKGPWVPSLAPKQERSDHPYPTPPPCAAALVVEAEPGWNQAGWPVDLSCELGVPPGLTTRRPESGDPSEGAPPSRPASGFNCAGIQWAPAVPQLTAKLFESGQETQVPSPPVICSPSWAHPKGPEAARIPWSSSKLADASQSWLGPILPAPVSQTHEHTLPQGQLPGWPNPVSPFCAVKQGPSLSPALGAVASPGSTRGEAVSLGHGVLAVLCVGEEPDNASLCPGCLWLLCVAQTIASEYWGQAEGPG